MNTDVLEGKWKQMRGQMKEWWGKLTDQDLEVIDGKRDKLIGALQEKYGWAKRDAENEVARRLREIDELTRPRESTFAAARKIRPGPPGFHPGQRGERGSQDEGHADCSAGRRRT